MFSNVLIKKYIMSALKAIKISIPKGRYFIYAAVFFATLISSIITTKRKRTITAPTYTRISIIDKNSAPRSSHKTADKKNEKTKFIAESTGFVDVMTLKQVNISSVLNIKNVINSIFIFHLHFYLLTLVLRIILQSLKDLFYS